MNIAVKTQNRKGGTPIWKEKLGYICTFIGDNMERYIGVDAYEGFGDNYRERKTPEIRIMGDNRQTLFLGTFDELKQKLLQ